MVGRATYKCHDHKIVMLLDASQDRGRRVQSQGEDDGRESSQTPHNDQEQTTDRLIGLAGSRGASPSLRDDHDGKEYRDSGRSPLGLAGSSPTKYSKDAMMPRQARGNLDTLARSGFSPWRVRTDDQGALTPSE
jgi:hypothetical protein